MADRELLLWSIVGRRIWVTSEGKDTGLQIGLLNETKSAFLRLISYNNAIGAYYLEE